MLEPHPEGCIIRVAVRPRAGRSRVAGTSGGRLRIEVSSAPERGEATLEALSTLAAALQVPRDTLRLLRGARTRHKDILILHESPSEVQVRLDRALEERHR